MFTTQKITPPHKDIPSSRGRPTEMLTGITKVKLPPHTQEEEEIVKKSSVIRCKTGNGPDKIISRTPASTYRSNKSGKSSSRRSNAPSGRSTPQRSSVGSLSNEPDLDTMKREKEFLEDQLWDVSHKADWLKAQTGLRTMLLTQSASPDRWLNNGAKMYMANRYKTTSMCDYVGYHGEDVFADQVTDQSNRKYRGQAAKYANRLTGAKITLRGNF